MPKISVIVPTYNRKKVIGRALESVLAQTLPPGEIIVIDDGSADGTEEYIAADYPLVKLIRQKNRGLSAGRNVGIANATGDLIAFLDTDDLWLPGKLEAQCAAFAKNPNLGLLGTQKYKNRTDYPVRRGSGSRIKFYPFSAFMKRTRLHPSTVVIPRSVLEKIGGFDESLCAAEDWDMWARIAYRYPAARLEAPLTAVYELEDSISKNRRRQYVNDARVLAKWDPARAGSLDTELRLPRLVYQKYVVFFTVLRVWRLLRDGEREAAYEFISHLEFEVTLSPLAKTLIRLPFVLCFIRVPPRG